jgi:hypothetical protein
MRRADFRFTRKDVRRFSHWSDFQVHTHISRLVSLEYVAIRRAGRAAGSATSWYTTARCRMGGRSSSGLLT